MNLNGIEILEPELKQLIDTNEFIFYREIKSIPNQVLGLKLRITDKCYSIKDDNPYNEPIYYQIRYDLDVRGTWGFKQRYGIALKKNIYTKYGLNEKLYIKEPFLKNDNKQFYYDFLNDAKEHKCTHQRYMKQEDARCFVQIVNVEIEKLENFYIKNEHDYSNVLNEDSLGTLQISLLKDNDKRTVEQQFYSHKYQLKYTCKLIENPLKKFVPQNKTRYFYRVQIPYTTTSENYNNISWKDFKLGYIEAESQKEARKLLEDEFDCTLPSKVINNDLIGSKYQYILKIFPPDAYWDKYWSSTRFCAVCSNEFTVMDKINHFGTNGDNCCSPDCDTINNAKYSFLREEEYVQKLMKDEEGIHQPCIYLISNLKTGMVYVGQTTQYSTFRWYQHFKRPYSGSKFHNAILEHDLSDWTFQVIEIINDKTLEDKNIPYSKKALYINQREQYYINLYDSINNGYNTATANKELHELKKITEDGLFTKEELFNGQ